MAKAYQYTADGYFVGEVEDYGLLPNNATYTAPQEQDGHIPRWTGEAWEQVENHKGQEGYVDGKPYTVKEYGPLPEDWSDTPPPPTLEQARAAKLAEIGAAYDAALIATLTMPAASPSGADVAAQAALFAVSDPTGLADVLGILADRRTELVGTVESADTVDAVQAVPVTFPV